MIASNRPTPEFLQSLKAGQAVSINQGKAGYRDGKILKITEALIWVKMGKEQRRFCKKDGGTFQAPTMSKSWLVQVQND